jgi:Tfp pilus assembly protein PilF
MEADDHSQGQSTWARRRRIWLIAGSVAAGILLVALLTFLLSRPRGRDRQSLPPERYREVVSAFHIGVAAMNANDNDRAAAKLTRSTQIAPQEPATWANLGLLHLRLGDFAAAGTELEKAERFAPQNGQVQMLLGLLADKRGEFAKAIAHFRKATELDPRHLRARYALVTLLERQGGAGSDEEVWHQLGEMLAVQPGNLVLLLDATRVAVKRGDAKAARDSVERVVALSDKWPAPVKGQLEALRQAVGGTNLASAAAPVLFLRNSLLQQPEFRTDMAAVQSRVERVGDPIEQFLTLPAPSPTPAPADQGLTFSAARMEPVVGGGWTCVAVAWLEKDGPPAIFAASAKELRRIDAKGATLPALPFPGGASATAPSPDGVLGVDWANNFRSGIVLAGDGGVRLFEQTDGGGFVDVTARAVPEPAVANAAYYGAWAADIDLEGDMDIVLGARNGPPIVLRNNADGTFTVIRPFENVSGLRAFCWFDVDGDGDPDACLVDAAGKLTVLTNERSGAFRPRPLPGTVANLVSLAVADVDRDGMLDLLALAGDGRILRISDRRDGAVWDVATLATWTDAAKSPAARLLAVDLDNNGAVDLVASGPTGGRAWLGDPQGKFAPLAAPLPAFALAAGALGANGQLELIGLGGDSGAVRVGARGGKNYHWQSIRPRSQSLKGDGRINSFGIGGEMEVRAGLLYQKAPVALGAVHFGLGENLQTDVVRIVWPNGSVQGEFELKADQEVTADQRLKGSCPMLFSHDGTRVQFVTDLIWRSPLGLRINAVDTAAAMQTQDWVKVRGDQLAPVDGHYDLRVTAELWETHYFDHVSLMVVDHPANTDVFVDERFAVPQPPLKVFVTAPPRPLAKTVDNKGGDLTAAVATRDGKYADTFGRGRYQGIAGDHWLELELGADLPVDKPLVLLAFGWVHPTDSSINVSISQGKHMPPRGLSMEVPDGKGGWRVVREGIGFPAGKNKTIVLPLDGLWDRGAPRRLRLRTNLEVFWDWMACAVLIDNPDDLKTQRLAAASADLVYRGFSVIEAPDDHSPELPDYGRIMGVLPRWRDLVGYYTRFGDVRELLRTVDDRYVIMNAGDEMRLRFAAPPAPSPGFVRDFVVIADGWEKDGDYNTAFSKTVLPLPRHDWPAYDAMPASLEDDPVYRKYPQDWVKYHTRYVGGEAFRQALRPGDR